MVLIRGRCNTFDSIGSIENYLTEEGQKLGASVPMKEATGEDGCVDVGPIIVSSPDLSTIF